jgi:hypothetical protein
MEWPTSLYGLFTLGDYSSLPIDYGVGFVPWTLWRTGKVFISREWNPGLRTVVCRQVKCLECRTFQICNDGTKVQGPNWMIRSQFPALPIFTAQAGLVVVEAVTHWQPGFEPGSRHVGVYGGQNGTGIILLRALRFPLPLIHSTITIAITISHPGLAQYANSWPQ